MKSPGIEPALTNKGAKNVHGYTRATMTLRARLCDHITYCSQPLEIDHQHVPNLGLDHQLNHPAEVCEGMCDVI